MPARLATGQTTRRLLTLLSMSLLTAALSAQTQAPARQKPYNPEVGQPGKDVVWVPTPQAVVDKMLDMAGVTAQDHLVDLGSGDGRTVIAAARRGARALGIEYNPEMVELSKRNAAAAGVSDRTSFMKADLFQTDFSDATVVTMFLLPAINMKLRPTLLAMRPGTRVVSNTFTMEDWEPDATARVDEGCSNWCTALLWIVPAKVEGSWRTLRGDLVLTQHFQKVSGTIGSVPIADVRLRGDEIGFTAGGAHYTGRVSGNTIIGTVKDGGETPWSATKR